MYFMQIVGQCDKWRGHAARVWKAEMISPHIWQAEMQQQQIASNKTEA
jgi:hypothetical protein